MNAKRYAAQFALSGVVIALAGCSTMNSEPASTAPMWQAGQEYLNRTGFVGDFFI
ncbi:MAG: hypothetical protein KC467_04665 [Marinomonas atlantica]|nr:hypothetical protein [Marinomonas atlantica]